MGSKAGRAHFPGRMIGQNVAELFSFNSLVYKSMNLLQNVTSTVNEVCKRLKMDQGNANGEIKPGRVTPSAFVALKNGRRKMEDRHTIIHDLNAVFESHAPKVSLRPFLMCFGFLNLRYPAVGE